MCEPICLDSNQYPEVYDGCRVYAEHETIPDKEVWIHFNTLWSGCELEEQEFLVTAMESGSEKRPRYLRRTNLPQLSDNLFVQNAALEFLHSNLLSITFYLIYNNTFRIYLVERGFWISEAPSNHGSDHLFSNL